MKYLLGLFLTCCTFYSFSQEGICDADSIRISLNEKKNNWTPFDLESEIGICYANNGEYELALDYFKKLEEKYFIENKQKNIALVQYYQGLINNIIYNDFEAIEYYNKCLVNPDLLENSYKCKALEGLGIIYLDHKEYQKSIDYFNKGIKIQKDENYKKAKYLDSYYNNKGIAFLEMGNFDSSRVNHNLCLKIRLSKDDTVRSKSEKNYYIGQSYNNLGSLSYASGNYDSALFFFEKGLEYREKVDNPQPSSFQESKINIAKVLIVKKQYSKAEKILIELEKIYKKLPNPSLEIRLNEQFKKLYADKGDFKKAFQYSQLFHELKDSLYGIEEREELIRLNLSSQYATKKLQDSLINVEREKRIELEKAKEIEIRKQEERESGLIMMGLTIALLLTRIIHC